MHIQYPRRATGAALFSLKKAVVLSLFTIEELVGLLIPLALVGLYWLVDVVNVY